MKPYPLQFKTAKLTELKNGQFAVLIKFPFDRETVEQVKNIPGRIYFPEGKFWTCPLKNENLVTLKKYGFQLDSSLQNFIIQEKYKKADIIIPGLKKQLMPFQKYSVIFLEEHNGKGILGDDMGLGKTIQALAWLQLHKNLKPVLIVIPGNLRLNWVAEIHEWIEETNIQILYGEKTYPLTGNIVIIGYEILKYWEKELIKFDPEVLICDEAHFLKTNTAQRTRALMHIALNIHYKILLSGTLEENRNKEIYNAWKIIDPYGCPPYKIFLSKYCGGEKMQNKGSTNLEELHFHLQKIMLRRLKEDVLTELPKRTIIVLPFDIGDRKNYNLAWSNFVEYVKKIKTEKNENNSGWGFARLEELKQLAVKGILPQVIEWIEDFIYNGRKLVVFVTHTSTLETIYNSFSEISVKMAGDTPVKDRKKIVDEFQTNSKIKLFIGMIDKEGKPAGVGWTLTSAYATLTVEQHWNPSPHDQADARVHRIGQTNKVFNYYAIAVNSIMEYIAKLHDKKRTITNKVLDNKDYENIFTELINNYK